VIKSGLIMKPIFERARTAPQRLVYTDGEEERVLRAVQVVVDERLAWPILIGRPEVIEHRIERLGLSLRLGDDFELCNPNSDPRYNEYVAFYLERLARRGTTPQAAREIVRTRRTVIAAVMLARGEADAMLAGPVGQVLTHLRHIVQVIGLRPEMHEASGVHALVLDQGALFIADTSVSYDPTAALIAEIAIKAAEMVRGFGVEPKVALISHSNFGSRDTPSAQKMREALSILRRVAPELEVDGEMQTDTALSQVTRDRMLPDARLKGPANLLIMPNLDTASATYNLVKAVTGAITIGPILIGPRQPAHIVNASVTSRGIVNMSAVACVDAINARRGEHHEAGSGA
jgi:malate dehydrogenase (oxaloacetate-decarboxylating)(NADP+)